MASMSGGQSGQTKKEPPGEQELKALLAERGEILRALDAKGESVTEAVMTMISMEAEFALSKYPILYREFVAQERLCYKLLRPDDDSFPSEFEEMQAKPTADTVSKPESNAETFQRLYAEYTASWGPIEGIEGIEGEAMIEEAKPRADTESKPESNAERFQQLYAAHKALWNRPEGKAAIEKAKPRADTVSKPELKLEPKSESHMGGHERLIRRPLETQEETVSGLRKKRKVASEQAERGQAGAATPAMPSMDNSLERFHKAQPDSRGRGRRERGDRGGRVTQHFRSRGRSFGPDVSSAPQRGGMNRGGRVFSSMSRQGSTLQRREQADATNIDESKSTPASRAEIIELEEQLEAIKTKIRDGDQQLLLMNENIELRRQLTASHEELRESRRELKAAHEQLSLRREMALGTFATETGQVKVEEDE